MTVQIYWRTWNILTNYLLIEKDKRNELHVTADIHIPNIEIGDIIRPKVKIDTGCSYTNIPVQSIGMSQDLAMKYKWKDLNNSEIKRYMTFGVNDSAEYRQIVAQGMNTEQLMDVRAVSFRHRNVEIEIGGIRIRKTISVNYDRTGNVLIGMDILSQMDMHMGKSKILDKTVLLACPYTMLNDDYYRALEDHFGLGNSLVFAQVFQPEQ